MQCDLEEKSVKEEIVNGLNKELKLLCKWCDNRNERPS